VKVNRELHGPTSDRSCMHIEFDIEASKMRYETGDHLAVYPVNNAESVNKIGEQCGASLDTVFTLTNTDGIYSLFIVFFLLYYFLNFYTRIYLFAFKIRIMLFVLQRNLRRNIHSLVLAVTEPP